MSNLGSAVINLIFPPFTLLLQLLTNTLLTRLLLKKHCHSSLEKLLFSIHHNQQPSWLSFFSMELRGNDICWRGATVKVDETTREERQDLLSFDMNHQYKIRFPFWDMKEISM